MGRYCLYRSCTNHESSKGFRVLGIKFFPVPKPSTNIELCKLWVEAINRHDIKIHDVKAHHHICSKHFVGGMGPTVAFPFPVKENSQAPFVLDHNYCMDTKEKLNHESKFIVPQFISPSESNHDNLNRKPERILDCEVSYLALSNTVDIISENEVFVDMSDNFNLQTSDVLIEKSSDHHPEEYHENREVSIEKTDFQNHIESLRQLVQEFFVYQSQNLDSLHWFVNLKQENKGNSLNITRVIFCQDNNNLKMEIDETFIPSLTFCNEEISDNHPIFKSNGTFFKQRVTSLANVLELLSEIGKWTSCLGIQGELLHYYQYKYLKSVKTCKVSLSLRSTKCQQVFSSKRVPICQCCRLTRKILHSRRTRERKKSRTEIKINTNIRYMSESQVRRKVAVLNKKNNALKKRIKLLETKIKRSFKSDGLFLSQEQSTEFENIIAQNPFESKSVFHRLLLREQLKLLISKKSRPRKWHPAIIQWCLSIKARSSSTYEAMRQAFILPSKRTLFNYSINLNTKSGFNDSALEEMREKIALDEIEEYQKYFSLVIDEIQVKQDLVFHRRTGELIGATNLNTFRNKVAETEKKILGTSEDIDSNPNLATHILQLMVRGITTNFKYAYAFFPCGNLKAEDIYSIVWEAIENLQGAGFRILCVVCDKASSNQKLIKICTESEKKLNNHEVGYRSKNPYSNGELLYFVSDICHAIKTAKNGVCNSGKMKKQKDGSSKPVRLLKKNGKFILWSHIVDTYRIDSTSILRLAPKLTYNHVYPNCYSAMKVKLATQVLSSTVANAIEELIGDEASETIKFIRLFDKFFDILNVSNTSNTKLLRKPDLAPFRSPDDWRFKWLEEDFLGYLDEWEAEVDEIEAEEGFDKSKMLLSRETMEGIRITVRSTIEIVKFLLGKGAPFVLTARLNQDVVENYFSKQRSACGAGENPTVNQYGQGAKRLKLMKSLMIKVTNGNCSKTKLTRAERRKDARNAQL